MVFREKGMAEDQTSVQATSLGSTGTGLSTFLLNSKRLTMAYIRQLAMALKIPTRALANDIFGMIEGKIREDECEPLLMCVEDTD